MELSKTKLTKTINAVTESGELECGMLLAGVIHSTYALRPATLDDTYQAALAIPVPDGISTNEAARVAYQMQVDDAQILLQLQALGTLDPVPSPQELMAELDPDDMQILREAAVRVKKKKQQLRTAFFHSAAPSTSSSVPGSD